MKIFIILPLIFLAAFSVPTEGLSAGKNKINLISPQGTQKEQLQKPDDSLKSFDVTTQKSRLDTVRAQESRQGNSIIDSSPHPSRHAYSKNPSDLDVDPQILKGLLYPPQKEEVEEELSLQTAKPTTDIATQEEPEEEKPFELAHHNPMLTDLGNGEFIVDESFENQIPTLIDMNKLSYAIGKRGTIDGAYDDLIEALKRSLNDQGWEIKEFEGKSGKRNRTDDTPGFVAYNKEKNIMTVILRGSQTREDEKGSADWEVNFDAGLIDFPFGGKVHGGFYRRSLSMMSHIQEAVDGFIGNMTQEEKSKVKIVISGHSQGAALASIIMPLLAEYFKAAKTFGENFNNAEDNVLQGYFISTPRVYSGDAALDWVHGVSGKHNMIRQNVTGSFLADPVPVASPGKTVTALISLIPFYGEGLAEKYGGDGGTKSVGYLAADWTSHVMTRTLGYDTLSLLGRRAHAYFWNRWDIAKDTVTKPWHLLTFQTPKSIFKKLLFEPVKDGLSTLFAPLHYGVTSGQVEEGEALFGPDVVAGYTDKSPTMAELLSQGFEKKKSEREGVSGIVRSAVESAAKIKHGLPDLPAAVSGIASTVKEKVTTGLKSAFSGFKKKLFGLW